MGASRAGDGAPAVANFKRLFRRGAESPEPDGRCTRGHVRSPEIFARIHTLFFVLRVGSSLRARICRGLIDKSTNSSIKRAGSADRVVVKMFARTRASAPGLFRI
jgi:hypothetical protein